MVFDGTRKKNSDRRRRYSRSLSRERIYRRSGASPDPYRDNSDGFDDERDRYRRDRRDRDRDRRYNYRGRASSESSNASYK